MNKSYSFGPEAKLYLNVQYKSGLDILLKWELSLLLVLIPFHSFIILQGISIVKAMGLVIAPTWMIWLLVKLRESNWSFVVSRQNTHIILYLGAFIISILLSAIYNPISLNFSESLMTILLFSGFVFVVFTLLSSESSIRQAYTCIAIGGMIFGVLVIIQFVAPQDITRFFGQSIFVEALEGRSIVRATGPFRDPNYAALTLIVQACISFFLAFTFQKRWHRIFFYFCFVIQVVAIFLTFSRGGYLTFAVVGFIAIWRERKRLHFWKLAFLVMIGLILLGTIGKDKIVLMSARTKRMISFASLLNDKSGFSDQVDLSLWYRFQLLQAGIKMALDKFPIGIGWENFRYKVTDYSNDVLPQVAHNTYITIAAELGPAGLIALACLIWTLCRSIRFQYRVSHRNATIFTLGSRYGILAILINGLFLNVLHEVILWVLIGLLMAQNNLFCQATTNKKRDDNKFMNERAGKVSFVGAHTMSDKIIN